MNQQSEHLSNAQIEQYGKRASGAGPETEAWVDQHLDDCSSCRSRVLDFQRTRFALFPNSKVNKVSSPNCPSEDDLRNLAAGLYTDPKAAQFKAHAATCGHCGPLLQEYIEDFSDESSPEEQAFLDQLRTSSPEFREQKAREMLKPETVKKNPVTPEPFPAPDWRRFFSWRWVLVPAMAVVVVAAITVPVYLARRDTPEKVEQLLAQAYTEQRTMEMRWPGAEWGPVRVTRGAGESSLSRSSTLLKAEEAITQRQIGSSSGADWLRVKGETELLDHQIQPAIDDLTQALKVDPGSIRLNVMLAIAYARQGDSSEDRRSYEQAAELLTKALQSEPVNSVALFNRAIVYQKLNLPNQAMADWNTFLRNEKNSAWANEARSNVEDLNKH